MPRVLTALMLRRYVIAAALSATVMAATTLHCRRACAIILEFDYSYDAAGFFGTAAAPTAARTALEFAGRSFSLFTDELAAIEPGGGNAWVAYFRNPATGAQVQIANLAVPQNAVRVYAGARDLIGGTLGEANYGIYSIPPGSQLTPSFSAAIRHRGQGEGTADFAPWGGAIEFDTASSGAPRNWHFDVNSKPPAGAFDFYSVAVHELGHLLGFGTASSFNADVAAGKFNGATAVNLYGGPVPLAADNQHWAATVGSPPFALGARPTPSLAASLPAGERRLFTPLDYAAMADTGWQVAPELFLLPGDIDSDRDVDGTDVLLWQRNLGGFGGSRGDINGDLRVDAYDGWLVRQHFGAQPAAAVNPASASVPEPAAVPLAASGLLACLRRLRRRRSA